MTWRGVSRAGSTLNPKPVALYRVKVRRFSLGNFPIFFIIFDSAAQQILKSARLEVGEGVQLVEARRARPVRLVCSLSCVALLQHSRHLRQFSYRYLTLDRARPLTHASKHAAPRAVLPRAGCGAACGAAGGGQRSVKDGHGHGVHCADADADIRAADAVDVAHGVGVVCARHSVGAP